MAIKTITGNIFTTNCQCIVNTVNCVGVMGAGIALECRLRYPELYVRYQQLCKTGEIQIGKLWLYRGNEKWILNFPTKNHWKLPSRKEYLEKGLAEFVESYEEAGIQSIAFPLLGAQHGGLDSRESQEIMECFLAPLPLDIEIYQYDSSCPDDLYTKIKDRMIGMDVESIVESVGIRKNYAEKILDAFSRDDVCQVNQLGKIKGLGIKTIEKVFNFATSVNTADQIQLDL